MKVILLNIVFITRLIPSFSSHDRPEKDRFLRRVAENEKQNNSEATNFSGGTGSSANSSRKKILSPFHSSDTTGLLFHLNNVGLDGSYWKGERESNQNAYSTEEKRTRTRIEKEARVHIQPRIVGGSSVEQEDDHPYFVEMAVGCGASLIHDNIILTAAHCLQTKDWNPTVWIGSFTRRDGIAGRVNGLGIHPGYRYFTNANDIRYDMALFTLDAPVIEEEDGFSLVKLNRNRDNPNGDDTLTVIGVGSMKYENSASNFATVLQELDVPYITHDECSNIYQAEISIDEQSMLCAGGQKNQDSCMGDSGGPILDSDGVQVGVVSFGAGCGREGWPGVYSRVSSAIDWIDEFICLNALSRETMPPSCGQRFRVQVEIEYDAYPNENSWYLKVRDEDRSVLFVPRDGTIGEGIYSRIVNLPEGKYSFQIEDSEGDGICCDFGGANYRIIIINDDQEDTEIIERNGAFGYFDVANFDLTSSGQAQFGEEVFSDAVPHPKYQNQIRIDIMYDNYPNETSWTLIDRESSNVIHVSQAGSVTKAGLQSTLLEVADGNYWLFVLDSQGDGICCFFGRGFVEINKVFKGADILIGSHRGNFESLYQFEFTVP